MKNSFFATYSNFWIHQVLKMFINCSKFIWLAKRAIPLAPGQDRLPQIITLPLQNSSVSWSTSTQYLFGSFDRAYLIPSIFSLWIVVSIKRMMPFWFSRVQFLSSKAHCNRAHLCTFDCFGFLTILAALAFSKRAYLLQSKLYLLFWGWLFFNAFAAVFSPTTSHKTR